MGKNGAGVESSFARINVMEEKLFEAPNDPAVRIWRYIDFTKFVSMLQNEGLWFSRADCLGDVFEGSLPPAHKQNRHEFYEKKRLEVIAKAGTDIVDSVRGRLNWIN